MEELSLKMLRDAGLALDWQTVCVGWRGFALHPDYDARLPSEEVRDFAYKSLEYATDSECQQALVSLIDADINGGFWQTMPRYGELLAARSGVTEATATYKWRCAAMYSCLRMLGNRQSTYKEYDYDFDSTFRLMLQEWNLLVSENLIPELESGFLSEEMFAPSLGKSRLWLASEERRLTEMGQIASPPAPLV